MIREIEWKEVDGSIMMNGVGGHDGPHIVHGFHGVVGKKRTDVLTSSMWDPCSFRSPIEDRLADREKKSKRQSSGSSLCPSYLAPSWLLSGLATPPIPPVPFALSDLSTSWPEKFPPTSFDVPTLALQKLPHIVPQPFLYVPIQHDATHASRRSSGSTRPPRERAGRRVDHEQG
jgi:hypothetical protein